MNHHLRKIIKMGRGKKKNNNLYIHLCFDDQKQVYSAHSAWKPI